MSKSNYSIDFRECVLAYLSRGHTIKLASEVFQVSQKTISNWKKMLHNNGHLHSNYPKRRAVRKIEDSLILQKINEFPDATLEEIASEFSCSVNAVWKRLKLLNITRKKNHPIRRTK